MTALNPMLRASYLFLAIFMVTCTLSFIVADQSIKLNTQRLFSSQLIKSINDSLESSYNDENVKVFITNAINQLLHNMSNQSILPVFDQCQVNIQDWLSGEHISPTKNSSDLTVTWRLGSTQQQMSANIDCRYAWPSWLFGNLIFSLLTTLLFMLLPRPYNERQQHWLKHCPCIFSTAQRKLSVTHIAQLSDEQYNWLLAAIASDSWNKLDLLACIQSSLFKSLTSEQLLWLSPAYKHYQQQLSPALHAANADPALVFDLQNKTVTLHGLSITLSITPFLYYFWYAQRRVEDINQGWLLNPATNKSDLVLGDSLAKIMHTYQGNTRAINDLQQNGLTPKKLDQNRNRIKDEIIAVLPEPLAQHYLFESKRDHKTARFTCRLALSGSAIAFNNLKEII